MTTTSLKQLLSERIFADAALVNIEKFRHNQWNLSEQFDLFGFEAVTPMVELNGFLLKLYIL